MKSGNAEETRGIYSLQSFSLRAKDGAVYVFESVCVFVHMCVCECVSASISMTVRKRVETTWPFPVLFPDKPSPSLFQRNIQPFVKDKHSVGH